MIRFLRIYVPLAIILVAICYSYYLLVSRDVLEQAKREDVSLAKLEQQLLADDFRSFASDLILFVNMKEWKHVFDDSRPGDLNELSDEFKTLLATKKNYEKIRLLDLHGKEVLRVHFHQSRVSETPTHALQDKSHRYYIAASSSLGKNEIYISPLDLNWENGNIEQPLEPSMRLISPVFDVSGTKRGLLVLNVLVDKMLQAFMDKHADMPRRSLIVDRKGGWIHDGMIAKNWKFLLPENQHQSFKEKHPDAWKAIHQHGHGQFVNEHGMFTFVTLRVLPAAYRALPDDVNRGNISALNNGQPVWKIIQYRSAGELAVLTAPLAQRIGAFVVLFLLLLIPLVWRMVSSAAQRQFFERKLRQSEHKFRHLVEDLPDALVVLLDGRIAYANKAAAELFHAKEISSLVGQTAIDFVHPESRQMMIHRIQVLMNGQLVENVEEHLLALDGSDIFAMVSSASVMFEGKSAVQTVIRDISKQRKAEGKLRIALQRHELYLAQTRMAIIEWAVDFTVVEWNRGAEIIFGFSAEDAIGKHVTELILASDQRAHVDAVWQQVLSNQGGHHSVNENITKDGRIITCEWQNTPLIRKDGKVIGVVSLCSDISEAQRRQAELHKLQQAIEHAGESVMITDVDAIIEYVNPAFSKISGFAADEVIGQTPKILKSGQQNDAFYQHFWQKISSGETWHGSLVDKRKDGRLYPALMSVAPILDEHGNITHYVSIQQDMSEHEELEEKFRQAQKMEALGTLVGGIAHDFNNVLAGILGNLYLLKKQTVSDAGVQTKLERIEKAGKRAADMIRQLLTFARKGESELTPMPVQPFIKEILKLARSSIPENIALLHDLGEQDYQIRGDGTQMQQMMLNLLVNASHALEGRDQPAITVSMNIYKPDEDFLSVYREIGSKPLLCITVADNGCGISKANLEHVLEPFFTTKEEGKGTGLGLAMVYGSMQNHGGVIDIDSEEGEGARVNLYFPLCESEKAAAKKETTDVICGKGETILLADDNEHVREIMQEILHDFGYRVLVAEHGQQALKMFMDHASEVGLALLDIVMPVMGGEEAAERLRELKPDLPILFLSGYEKGVSPGDKAETQNITILTKPVDLAELSHHIHKSLGT